MLIKKGKEIRSSEITPKSLYLNRRKFLAGAAIAGAAAASGIDARELISLRHRFLRETRLTAFRRVRSARPRRSLPTKMSRTTTTTMSSRPKGRTGGTGQEFPHAAVEGEDRRPGEEEAGARCRRIIKMAPPEERIYRHRCVEGWSIVVPWVGFSLSELIKRVNPPAKRNL